MHPDQASRWNYSDEDALGPSKWPKYFQTGDSQSPINIIVDHCYLSATNQGARPALGLHAQLDRKLAIGGRRPHLDSVGDDLNESQYSPDPYENHLKVHHDRRSHSASSNESNESSASNEPAAPDADEYHRKYHSHHSRDQQQQQLQLNERPRQPSQRQLQNTRYCGTNKKIFLGYPRYLNSVRLSNTGHGWQIDMPPELACHTLLSGPPLGDREYRLAQFHCHWGEDCDHGSEHQVNGRSYSAELHFVHWNFSQFRSIEEASKHKHGLAVLGVFLQALEGEQNRNKHLDKILAGVEDVRDRPNGSTSLSDIRLDLKKLFPSNRWDYATYEGSLTTPPLSECVDWLVFLQPITCSSSQIETFRRLRCPSGSLTKNCRPVQPLNKRTVTIWTHYNDPVGRG